VEAWLKALKGTRRWRKKKIYRALSFDGGGVEWKY
jgi:hypothetical protein